MTKSFEPVIRTDTELAFVLEAVKYFAMEVRELSDFCESQYNTRRYAEKAAVFDKLALDLEERFKGIAA